jgi:hypothetical protein
LSEWAPPAQGPGRLRTRGAAEALQSEGQATQLNSKQAWCPEIEQGDAASIFRLSDIISCSSCCCSSSSSSSSSSCQSGRSQHRGPGDPEGAGQQRPCNCKARWRNKTMSRDRTRRRGFQFFGSQISP